MEATDALTRLGGVASTHDLLRLTARGKLRTAVRDGAIRRVGAGRYALPGADKALKMAAELRGMASHASATRLHGWEIAFVSPLPTVSVPRNRVADNVRAPWFSGPT